MNELRAAAESYLAMRRTLGFKLTTQGRTLMRFVTYCEAHHADHITADIALAWAIDTPRSSDEVYWSRRLMVVRRSCRRCLIGGRAHLHRLITPFTARRAAAYGLPDGSRARCSRNAPVSSVRMV